MAECQAARVFQSSFFSRFIFHSRSYSLGVNRCARPQKYAEVIKHVTSPAGIHTFSLQGKCPGPARVPLLRRLGQKRYQTNLQSAKAGLGETQAKTEGGKKFSDVDIAYSDGNLELANELHNEDSVFCEQVLQNDEWPGTRDGVLKRKKRKRTHVFIDEAVHLAEIDACLFCGNVEGAIEIFNQCRRQGHRFEIDTYNSILHGLAAKKRSFDFQMFFHSMAGDSVRANLQTYAAFLELYGLQKNVRAIKDTCDKIERQGFNLKHIFLKSVLTKDQATRVLEAIRSVYPDYESDVYIGAQTRKNSPLVNSLYENHGRRIDLGTHTISNTEPFLRDSAGLLEEQLKQEILGFGTIKSVETKKERQFTDEVSPRNFSEMLSQWKENLAKAIEKEIEISKEGDGDKKKRIRSELFTQLMVPCHEYADLVVEAITGELCSRTYGAPVNQLSWLVGTMVFHRYSVKNKEKSGFLHKFRKVYGHYLRLTCDSEICKAIGAREVWRQLDQSMPYEGSIHRNVPAWPVSVRVTVGCTLLDMLIRECHIDPDMLRRKTRENTPAFFHTYEYEHTTVSGYIKAHPIVVQLYQEQVGNSGRISLSANKLPMLVPPRPWTAITNGGHLLLSVQLTRGQDRTVEALASLQEADKNSRLNAIYDSLNCLGFCPWRVNGKILDILIDIFNDKGSELLGIPGPDLPQVPEFDPEFKNKPELYTAFLKEKTNSKKLQHEAHSLRVAMLYHLSVANHFRDKTFWMPCNLDFRGRAYPIPPYGSHVGDDTTRGILMFARGRPLGPKGLDWLKVHLVNLHGQLKKATLQERIEFADAHLEEIHDSADNPMTGKLWWQTADDKWQTLATCMEISAAIRSGDPQNFVSHLPVQQDGSCNGLQHYAALGRDEYGGKQVNVLPSDRPEDVYAEVAKVVEKMCKRDAAKGVEIAKQMVGNVSRKVVKQTVMTVVYGVTFIGGRQQIGGQLDGLGLSPTVVWKGASYLTKNVFASIREMFNAAKDIQDWFTIAAAQIALSGHCVDWVTPLNLPVIQNYRRMIKSEVRTPLQLIKINVPATEMLPSLVKQKGGFPPNFIHSLDSCHMMLTALYCQKEGLTFTSVHDSFWTHARDVDAMNKVCREQFVSLHSQPILEDLQKHFVKKFGKKRMRRPLPNSWRDEVYFDPLPQRGTLDLNQVRQSTYFFS